MDFGHNETFLKLAFSRRHNNGPAPIIAVLHVAKIPQITVGYSLLFHTSTPSLNLPIPKICP